MSDIVMTFYIKKNPLSQKSKSFKPNPKVVPMNKLKQSIILQLNTLHKVINYPPTSVPYVFAKHELWSIFSHTIILRITQHEWLNIYT